jgi:hypothetical protein
MRVNPYIYAMGKVFFTAFILLISPAYAFGQHRDSCCHIEIYLLNGTYTFRPDGFSPIGYFMPQHAYLADTPLVHDYEITGYEVPSDSMQPYYLNVTGAISHRLDSLAKNAPQFDGLPIAVAVDGEPVFGAYIWNLSSRFGCDWIMAVPFPGRLIFYPGLPHYCFSPQHPDPRADRRLIDRLERTYRIIHH